MINWFKDISKDQKIQELTNRLYYAKQRIRTLEDRNEYLRSRLESARSEVVQEIISTLESMKDEV